MAFSYSDVLGALLHFCLIKVETIGDCYVAVTGLPDPQPDHALRMTKFARECMRKVTDLTHKLETTLGPDTSDLSMRYEHRCTKII